MTSQAQRQANADKKRAAFEAMIVADRSGPVPVLGHLGVRFVDAVLAHENKHERGPSWFALSVLIRREQTSTRHIGAVLRQVGVVSWTEEKYSLRVVGRYREEQR